jgi:hypothetical protein
MSLLQYLRSDERGIERIDPFAALRARLMVLLVNPLLAAGLPALTPDLAEPSTWRLRDYAIAVHRLEQLAEIARAPLQMPEQISLDKQDQELFKELIDDMCEGIRCEEMVLTERLDKARNLRSSRG